MPIKQDKDDPAWSVVGDSDGEFDEMLFTFCRDDDYIAIYREIQRRLGGGDWRPIDTAPKDGTVILSWVVEQSGETEPVLVAWHNPGLSLREPDFYDWPERRWRQPATHWIAIPEPPHDT
jgi:hypothetical protein